MSGDPTGDMAPGDTSPAEMAPGDEAPPGTPGAGENTCPACGGAGKLDGAACDTCGGTGVVLEEVGGA
jgi:hypothetical protein